MSLSSKTNTQLEKLPHKIQALTETDASKELYSFINRVQKEKGDNNLSIAIVGNGNNYASALCIKYLMIEKYHIEKPILTCSTSSIISQLKEYDRQYDKPNFDLVICIDFDGNSPDSEELAKFCAKNDYHFLFITALPEICFDKEIYLNGYMNYILSCDYFEQLTDTFPHVLSFIATLAPIILFYDDTYQGYWHIYEQDLKNGENFVSGLNIDNIVTSLHESPVIHVFYNYSTEATAYDIKHKFEASGIAAVILHEKNSFVTGDANILLNDNIGLVIDLIKFNGNTRYNRNIEDFLQNFCKKNEYPYIYLGSLSATNSVWNITEMMKLPYLIAAIGNELGVDVVNPKKQITKEETQLTFN